MAITKRPNRYQNDIKSEEKADAFISQAGKTKQKEQNKKAVLLRVEPELIERIDKAAKRLGISRAAFIVSSAARELEKTD